MDLFDHLKHVTLRAQLEADLPDYLAARVMAIAEDPDRYRHQQEALEELAKQVGAYDTFGQTGYIGMGVDHLILESSLDRIEAAARSRRDDG